MWPAVRDRFPAFSAQFEGRIAWMYLDIKGLVTTGVGNLIDPIGCALGLPWAHKSDSSPAGRAEIQVEWERIKGATYLAKAGWRAAGAITTLQLLPAGIDALVLERLDIDDKYLAAFFPNWADFPADAQLGMLSMAWAMGPGFVHTFKNFVGAVNAGDWASAAKDDEMNATHNPGLKPRNAADFTLFNSATITTDTGRDPSQLYTGL